ncbi:EF-hand domain-containing protein [Pseudoxanthomonas wuyuanensis]
MSSTRSFSLRRKILIGFVVALLATVAYLHFTGAAGTSGIPSEEMDWDGDGTVTEQEIMQAFYAVVVEKSSEGNRECRAYAWRTDNRPIRLDCKTTFQSEDSPE